MIGVTLDKEVVEAGDFLSGTVQWAVDGDQATRHIVVMLRWETDGTGNRANGNPRAVSLPIAQGRREGSTPFRMMIPHEGPITFDGELVQVRWSVRVHVDRRGLDERTETEFRVVARGARP